jgi:hypothetical protein
VLAASIQHETLLLKAVCLLGLLLDPKEAGSMLLQTSAPVPHLLRTELFAAIVSFGLIDTEGKMLIGLT